MKKMMTLLTTLLLLGWSVNAWSFACKTATGATIPIGGGSANVYVNLTPAVNVGQNLVVDLSYNEAPPMAGCCRVFPAP